MKKTLLYLLCLATLDASAKVYHVSSPDKNLTVTVDCDGDVAWSMDHDGENVLMPSEIGIDGLKMTTPRQTTASIDHIISTPFYKKSEVRGRCNEMTLRQGDWEIEFRAYDDAAAYRFVYRGKKPLKVQDETNAFVFGDDYKAYVPYINDNRGGERYCYSFESYYDEQNLSRMFPDSLAISPLMVCLPDGKKAVIMDAGIDNYPGMFLKKGEGNALVSEYAPVPDSVRIGGHNRLNLVPVTRMPYIATISPGQKLPWRVVLLSDGDEELLNNDIAQLLAPECRIDDVSWIKPGKVAWDWWNTTNLTNVDFKAGMNTATYLYFIDFAAANGLEYIIIDEGWSGKESMLEDLNPDIDLERIIKYGKDKNVGVILWASWRNAAGIRAEGDSKGKVYGMVEDAAVDADDESLYRPLPQDAEYTARAFKHYADMGVAGFKIDFFDRDDQDCISSAYEIARIAADNGLVLDLHGLRPGGMQRAYPNILNFEGVKGLENCKWEPIVDGMPLHDMPRYDVTAPYLRQLTGPMDYTPGAMQNAIREMFRAINDHPMSMSTRAHQVAMYTIFEAPLQMLADSPSKYMKEQETTSHISQIPTTFDETVAIDGSVGEYIVLARRKGNVWYVAAMTNSDARDIDIPLSFLSPGDKQAQLFMDGINADREGSDYRAECKTVDASDVLRVHLAPAGGFSAIIK